MAERDSIVFAMSAAVVLPLLGSCGPVGGPGVAWTDYRPDLIQAKFSDQGPFGGTRWIQWSSEGAGTFVEAEVRGWAEEQGWKYLSRAEYPPSVVCEWETWDKRPIFPLIFTYRPLKEVYFGDVDKFPRHVDGELVVLEFDSGWIRVRPGSGETITAIGYVVIGEGGKKLALYHAWGEI